MAGSWNSSDEPPTQEVVLYRPEGWDVSVVAAVRAGKAQPLTMFDFEWYGFGDRRGVRQRNVQAQAQDRQRKSRNNSTINVGGNFEQGRADSHRIARGGYVSKR
jgi:hypothetical protein